MQAPDLTALKAEGPFLRDVPHHTLQQALMDLRHATERWRSGAAGRPRYEGRYADDSFRFPDPRQVTVLAIGLKLKAGVVPWVMHWPVPPGAVARREGKRWYAAVLRERPDDLATAQPIASPEAVNDLIVLGVDVGIDVPLAYTHGSAVLQREAAALRHAVLDRPDDPVLVRRV